MRISDWSSDVCSSDLQQLSNAPEYVVTTGFTYTPEINAMGMRALFHADMRYMSDFNTGSDLFPEKRQDSVTTLNARIGLTGPGKAWSLELDRKSTRLKSSH